MTNIRLFKSAARQLAGLDISSSAVKMVELSGDDKSGFRVERYAIEPLPAEAVVDGNIAHLDDVAEAIRRAHRRMGPGLRHVAMALPPSAVIVKRIVLPAGLREHEMESLVESEASQYIPFALDEVNLDFHILEDASVSADEVEVLVAASRKEKVEDRVAAAEAAGLKAVVMDVESFAIQTAFELVRTRLPASTEHGMVALVDIGAHTTTVSMLRDGQHIYTREQSLGGQRLTQDIARHYGMSFEEAEIAKRNSTLPDTYEREVRRPFLDALALEVTRALQFFFTSTQYNRVDHVVLAGGSAVLADLVEVVAARAQSMVTLANPFAGMAVAKPVRPAALLDEAPALMMACGLALRRFDA